MTHIVNGHDFDQDHYASLGVAEDATHDEIVAAHNDIAQQLYSGGPDQGAAIDNAFADIHESFKLLSDNTLRQEYNTYINSPEHVRSAAAQSTYQSYALGKQEAAVKLGDKITDSDATTIQDAGDTEIRKGVAAFMKRLGKKVPFYKSTTAIIIATSLINQAPRLIGSDFPWIMTTASHNAIVAELNEDIANKQKTIDDAKTAQAALLKAKLDKGVSSVQLHNPEREVMIYNGNSQIAMPTEYIFRLSETQARTAFQNAGAHAAIPVDRAPDRISYGWDPATQPLIMNGRFFKISDETLIQSEDNIDVVMEAADFVKQASLSPTSDYSRKDPTDPTKLAIPVIKYEFAKVTAADGSNDLVVTKHIGARSTVMKSFDLL